MGLRYYTRAFTLIELLAAMTILTIMVLLISRIFSDSSSVWRAGAKRVESNTDGRAVVDFMVRELSAALCDDKDGPLGLVLDSKFKSCFGMDSDAIFFVSSDQVASGTTRRQVRPVAYAVRDGTNGLLEIRRYGDENLAAVQACYDRTYPANKSLAGNPSVLAENVRTLEFWVYDKNGKCLHTDYDSKGDGRPSFIDVYVEMLGKDDAVKASLLGSKDYCDRNVRRYVGRAYLHANGGKP